jgi:pyruvate/2-oxoglutarate dehydrogenase complex dihydrolipoamide acyltransferase (E2) component
MAPETPGSRSFSPFVLPHCSPTVKQVLARLGDTVKQGQPLLSIESPEVGAAMAAYRRSEAGITQAPQGESNALLFRAETPGKEPGMSSAASTAHGQSSVRSCGRSGTICSSRSPRVKLELSSSLGTLPISSFCAGTPFLS